MSADQPISRGPLSSGTRSDARLPIAGRQDQAEEDDAERIDRMTQEYADALEQGDLGHHEADADQREVGVPATVSVDAARAHRRSKRNDDRRRDENRRYEDQHGQGQGRAQVAAIDARP